MRLHRHDVRGWLAASPGPRRLDLSAVAEEKRAVEEICERVRVDGDAALAELGRRFDGWAPARPEEIVLGPEAMAGALGRLPAADRAALELAAERITSFHRAQAYAPVVESEGRRLLTMPVRRAGAYVPGGRAVYPSTVLMSVIPARVAGVAEVVVATPPRADGSVADPVLAAAAIAGVDAVYRAGGAQAIAALAYGTPNVPPVDVVVGPGNVYVTLAKREVFGAVGVDAIAGPTEIMVVADRSATPRWVAADLVSQLEHDPMAWAVLVTDSAGLLDAVDAELADAQGDGANCVSVLTGSMEEAIAVANRFGPEHLALACEGAERLLPSIVNAGAVFVGPRSAVSFGDYVIGTNHTLPTAGSARFGSPLGVHTFLRRMAIAEVAATDVADLAEAALALARMEGFPAHARAVEVRLDG
jgi:histidinol dehydrogenase